MLHHPTRLAPHDRTPIATWITHISSSLPITSKSQTSRTILTNATRLALNTFLQHHERRYLMYDYHPLHQRTTTLKKNIQKQCQCSISQLPTDQFPRRQPALSNHSFCLTCNRLTSDTFTLCHFPPATPCNATPCKTPLLHLLYLSNDTKTRWDLL